MTRPQSDSRGPIGVLAVVLFVIYALVLVGVVLFKLPFNYQTANIGREVNLIPFAGSAASGGGFDGSEIVSNVAVFVPLGIYLSMLRARWGFGRTLATIAGISIVFEIVQFSFAIGRADITDVISNTAGGLLGMGIYAGFAKLLGARTNRVVTVVALVASVLLLAFFGFLFAHSPRN